MNYANFEIVVGSENDIKYVIDLGQRTAETSISDQRPAEAIKVQQAYLRMLDFAFSRKPVIFLAKADDENIGFLIYADFLPDDVTGEDQAFVAYMAVEPEARGNGIARKLLAAAEDYARSQGLYTMALMVTENNTNARSVYEKTGYTTERRLLCKKL